MLEIEKREEKVYFGEDLNNKKFLAAAKPQYQVNGKDFRKPGSDRSPSRGDSEFSFP